MKIKTRKTKMDTLINLISFIFIFIGSITILIGSLGLLRLPDVFSRIHAAGMIDTAGASFVILGMILQSGFSLITAKLVFIGIFIFFTSPITGHVTANLARKKGVNPLGKTKGKIL